MEITRKQYGAICLNGLGLRSNDSADKSTLKAASYAMCVTNTPSAAINGAPDGWYAKLQNTIKKMLEFDDSGGKYLTIVSGVYGTADDYKGCFPKSSTMPKEVYKAVKISGMSEASLVKWVIDNIPSA